MGSRNFGIFDTQDVTNPLKLQIISFLSQHMYYCGKVHGKFSDKFGRSLCLVRELFPFAFPYREYCQYHPLYRVKVSGGPCIFPSDKVLPQVAVKVPVHAFYGPMHSGYCAQPPGASLKTGDIEPSFGRFLTVRFPFRCSPYFDNRQISIPLFPVRNQVIPTKDTAYPGLYPAMFKERPFRIYIHRLCKSDIVLNPISQSPLVRLQLDKKSPPFSRILSMMAFWKDMASAVTMHPDTSTLSSSLGTEVISLLFLRTCPWQV